MKYFHKAHCSGHASKSEILDIVKKINPKLLIPVHTQNPKAFEGNVRVVKEGEKVLMHREKGEKQII